MELQNMLFYCHFFSMINVQYPIPQEKGKITKDEDFLKIKDKFYKFKSIPEQIEEQGLGQGIELYPFQKTIYNGLDDMLEQIYNCTKEKCKKYIYAYDTEPDHTMHDYGPDSIEAKRLIEERNTKIEELCKNLKNTIFRVKKTYSKLLSKDETMLKCTKKYCKKRKNKVQQRGEKYGKKYKPNTENER